MTYNVSSGTLSLYTTTTTTPPNILRFAVISAGLDDSECLTTLLPTVFTQRNFVADFLQDKSTFIRQMATFV